MMYYCHTCEKFVNEIELANAHQSHCVERFYTDAENEKTEAEIEKMKDWAGVYAREGNEFRETLPWPHGQRKVLGLVEMSELLVTTPHVWLAPDRVEVGEHMLERAAAILRRDWARARMALSVSCNSPTKLS